MLIERDYILRMIQRMGDFLRGLMKLAALADQKAALEAECLRQCGLRLDAAERLTDDSLTALLAPMPRLAMSELYYARAQMEDMDDDARERLYARSLRLLLSLEGESLICELRRDRLTELYSLAGELLTIPEMMACVDFLILGEDYPGAEDVLFDAVNTAGAAQRQTALNGGHERFSRLLQLTDKQLVQGGYARPELVDTLKDLETLGADK